MDFRSFDGFFEGHVGQDGGETFGKHTFSGARRADHEGVMPAGSSDFQGAAGGLLPFDLRKIRGAEILFPLGGGGGNGRQLRCAGQEVQQLPDMGNGKNVDPIDNPGFSRVGRRYKNRLIAFFPGMEHHRQNAGDAPDFPAKGELAQKSGLLRQGGELP